MKIWVSNLSYVKAYWAKQEIRSTVIDDERFARLALEDEEEVTGDSRRGAGQLSLLL